MTEDETAADARVLKLVGQWVAPEDQDVAFADQLLLSFRGNHHILSFGRVDFPMIHPENRAAQDDLEKKGTLDIKAVARIIVPREVLEDWSVVIAQHVARFAHQEESSDNGNATDE